MRITLYFRCFASLERPHSRLKCQSCTRCLPESGKIGSVLKIQGDFLGKTKVDEVYLTDHTFDMKVKVLAQTEDSIEFRVPPFVKPGRLQLLVKTTGKEPMLLEQPVYITIEEVNAKDGTQKKSPSRRRLCRPTRILRAARAKSRQRNKVKFSANTARPSLLLLLLLLLLSGRLGLATPSSRNAWDQSSATRSDSSGGASDGATWTATSNSLSADPLNTPLVGGTSA